MDELTGFIEKVSDDHIRVYSAADPSRYIDVNPADVDTFQTTDADLIGLVRLRPEATVTEGILDDATYNAYFTIDRRPHPDSAFNKTTSFEICHSRVPPPPHTGYC